eukprot:TRINITY_DN10927_c0_g2_i2.p1 TRINITY_DN10927_c0_g2~~TRINITY_DN10927_c0_g2_i2.p1  ORF type:complete len:175 (-),score=32.66 TRINITY_DN10927_c0_g2_i2:77-601(-)
MGSDMLGRFNELKLNKMRKRVALLLLVCAVVVMASTDDLRIPSFVKEDFDHVDKNRDGEITFEEMNAVLTGNGGSEKDTREFFERADRDQDGKLNLDEYARSMIQMSMDPGDFGDYDPEADNGEPLNFGHDDLNANGENLNQEHNGHHGHDHGHDHSHHHDSHDHSHGEQHDEV